MLKFIIRRLLLLPLVAIGVTFLLFSLTQILSPEMRASLYIQDPRQVDSLREVIRMNGLDQPAPVQYFKWLTKLSKGELGYSETAKMPVIDAVRSYLPATIELAVASMIPIIFIGIWLGTLSAVNRGKFADNFSRAVTVTGYSMPTFVIGLLLLMIFYGKLRWLGPGRCGIPADIRITHSTQLQKLRTHQPDCRRRSASARSIHLRHVGPTEHRLEMLPVRAVRMDRSRSGKMKSPPDAKPTEGCGVCPLPRIRMF